MADRPPSNPDPSPAAALEASAVLRLTGGPPPTPRRRRRWLRVLLIIAGLLGLLYAALPWLIPPAWLARLVADDLARQLSIGLPRPITVSLDADRTSISWTNGIILHDLQIGAVPGYGEQPLLTIEKIQADFSPIMFLVTKHLTHLVVTEPVLRVVVGQDRTLNLSAFKGGKGDVPALNIVVEGGEVIVDDEVNRQTLVASLSRIEVAIDVLAAKARLSGELLESLTLDGVSLINPDRTHPLTFDVQMNLPALNPSVVLDGDITVGWDWVDLNVLQGEALLAAATPGNLKLRASQPADDRPAWLHDLLAGRIRGKTKAGLTVKLLPDGRITLSGAVEARDLALPGFQQRELAINLDGVLDPITRGLDLRSVKVRGDGWSVQEGTKLAYQPEADEPVRVQARVAVEPARLAEVLGVALPPDVRLGGAVELQVDYVRRVTDDRRDLTFSVDFTALRLGVGAVLDKATGQPAVLAGRAALTGGVNGALLANLVLRLPGVVASADRLKLPAPRSTWQQARAVVGQWAADTPPSRYVTDVVPMVNGIFGRVEADAGVQVESFEKLATWLPAIRAPVAHGELAGSIGLRASYQPVDIAGQLGQIHVALDSVSDQPVRLGRWLVKPAGRLLTAAATWQFSIPDWTLRRLTCEAALGRAHVRLGSDAEALFAVEPDGPDLRWSADLRLPVEVDAVDQWLAACPALADALADQRLAGNFALDLAARAAGRVTQGPERPMLWLDAARVGGEFNGDELALAVVDAQAPRPRRALLAHAREQPLRLAGDYRYARGTVTPHEAWLEATADGGRVTAGLRWSAEHLEGEARVDVRQAQRLLAQSPHLDQHLRSVPLTGAVRLDADLQGRRSGPDEWTWRWHAAADLSRLKVVLVEHQILKPDEMPLQMAVAGGAIVRGAELSWLALQAGWTADRSSLQVGVVTHAGPPPPAVPPVQLDVATPRLEVAGASGPASQPVAAWTTRPVLADHTRVNLQADLTLSNALRAAVPVLGQFANRFGLSGRAVMNVQVDLSAEEVSLGGAVDATATNFTVGSWVQKKPGTPAVLRGSVAAQDDADGATVRWQVDALAIGGNVVRTTGQARLVNAWPLAPEGDDSAQPRLDALEAQVELSVRADDWATLFPCTAEFKPAGAADLAVQARWADGAVAVPAARLEARDFSMHYGGEAVGFDGQVRYSPAKLDIPTSRLTVGGQVVNVLMAVDTPATRPVGTVVFAAREFDQGRLNAWLNVAAQRGAEHYQQWSPASRPASQPASQPSSTDFFATDPGVYTPPLFVELFKLIEPWDLHGELYAERGMLVFKDGVPSVVNDLSLRWSIAERRFRLDFSTSQSGGWLDGYLTFPLTEPNPYFDLALNFRDFLRAETGPAEGFPGLFQYGYNDRGAAQLQPRPYDLPNPAITGAGSFYTILDKSRARLFGPGDVLLSGGGQQGKLFYEGPGNWHVGSGVMIFGPGYLAPSGGAGLDLPPEIARLFPGLNLRRVELERVFNWFEKTADGLQKDNLLFIARSGSPLVQAYNLFAIGSTDKNWTRDPLDPRYLLGRAIDYDIGLDLLGVPSDRWKDDALGRVPLMRQTGYLAPWYESEWNPARGPLNKGALVDQRISFVGSRLIEQVLGQASPLQVAYDKIKQQWDALLKPVQK